MMEVYRDHVNGCIDLKCPKMASCTEIICDDLYEWARLRGLNQGDK